MSKVCASKFKALAKHYNHEFINYDGSVLKCDVCDSVLKIDKKHQRQAVEQHIRTLRHRENMRISAPMTPTLSISKFNSDLTKALIQSNIPLFKISFPAFRKFLEKYTQKKIPDESTLRKFYIGPIYDETIEKIKSIIGDSDVCFIVDETTDAKQRFVLNILVMPLNGAFVKPMLLKMYELEHINNSTVMQSINDACVLLWHAGVKYDRVVLVVSDQVSYMKLALSNLKALFPRMHHITCLAQSLHRVCESIRDRYDLANSFIKAIRKLLLKAPSRIKLYKEVTGLPQPPDPIITRWGSWIRTASFLFENYDKIKEFVDRSPTDCKAAVDCKRLVDDDTLKDEIFNVAHFKFLTVAIEKLETSGLKKDEQWQIYVDAGDLLTGFSHVKFVSNMNKNPDVEKFVQENNHEFQWATLYAPLVSVDIERSFSPYKILLTDRRRNLTFENVEHLCIVSYNSFLFE